MEPTRSNSRPGSFEHDGSDITTTTQHPRDTISTLKRRASAHAATPPPKRRSPTKASSPMETSSPGTARGAVPPASINGLDEFAHLSYDEVCKLLESSRPCPPGGLIPWDTLDYINEVDGNIMSLGAEEEM